MLDNQIEEIELSIEEAKKMVAVRDSLYKLMNNRDWRKIIEERYLKDEAVRLTGLVGDNSPRVLEMREEIIISLQGISKFRQFLQDTIRMGDMAENSIIENEEILDDMRNEEIQ